LKQLNKVKGIEACAILSTCNRSESYAIVDNDNAKEILSDYLAKIHNIDRMEISPYLVYFEGDDALQHKPHGLLGAVVAVIVW
jgi:glutamyl-tRNA reductase